MISTAEAKAFMGISVSTYDTLIGTFIDYSTANIEAYVGRNLHQATYSGEVLKYLFSTFDLQEQTTPTLDLDEQYPQVFLKNRPVLSSGLAILDDTTTLTIDSDYTIDLDNGVVTLYGSYSDFQKNLTANYTAGYTVSGTGAYPNDLKLICCEAVKELFERSGTATQGSGNVQSKSVGDFSVTYGSGLYQFLTNYNHILKKYMNISI